MTVPTWGRPYIAKIVVWAFRPFFGFLNFHPGDCLLVYDPYLVQAFINSKAPTPYPIPIIDAHAYEGRVDILMTKLSFKELTELYNIALKAHQEELCKTIPFGMGRA